ncbi:MAG TPA: TonB-dependent receptor [Methylophilus sp.]|nr:TonB-dependent receptor [Methylophilus sp.]
MYEKTSHLQSLRPRILSLAVAGIFGMLTLNVTSAFSAEANQQTHSQAINIPAQSLSSAITTLSKQTGIQVYADGALLEGRTAPDVNGNLTVNEAIRRLLQGTGLKAIPDSKNNFTIQKQMSEPSQLPEVSVRAAKDAPPSELPKPYAGGQVARGAQLGVLGNLDIMDTPFSVTSYTAKTIQNQQAQSVADVVANDPSIRNVDPSNSGYANFFNIRGFLLGNGAIAMNGLYGIAPNNQSTLVGIERVEVLKGPAAFLYGISPSGTGGAINLVTKRASDQPLTQLTTSYLSNTQIGQQVDIGRRFGDNKAFGIRANALYRDGDRAVDEQSQRLRTGTLGLDYKGERVRLSMDLGYQEINTDRANSTISAATGVSIAKIPDANKSYMSPWNKVELRDSYGMLRGEFDITPNLNIYAAGGKSHTDWKQILDFGTLMQTNGNFLSSSQMNFTGIDRTTAEVGMRSHFETGPVHHQIVLNATGYEAVRTSAGTIQLGSRQSNIYNPSFNAEPIIPSPSRRKSSDTHFYGYAVADTLSVLDDRLQLTLGLRQQEIKVENFSIVTGATTSEYRKSALTPSAGIVVKPASNVSLYANYIEALQQGTTVGVSFTNAGQVFSPFLSKQHEVGAKVDWGNLASTLSFFHITQASGIANTATNTFTADGEQRNRGIEWNLFGEPWQGIRLLGGVMLLDADLTKTANGSNDGKTAPGTARTNITFGGEWDPGFVEKLTLNARVTYTSKQYVDASNLQSLDSWNTFDVGARYLATAPNGQLITLRANVRNLFGENYWTTYPGAATLNRSDPRTLLLSATIDF